MKRPPIITHRRGHAKPSESYLRQHPIDEALVAHERQVVAGARGIRGVGDVDDPREKDELEGKTRVPATKEGAVWCALRG